ncbi:uncharacterized protein KY384_000571 [Bacidia gigantensis]|uniref:uncharacterized protein n=1 Tax=Bacidia gigantensis TaxID=2732470 RepID=UPI001D0529A2|nr:uncharacterized protein KY384_000571 [Bacidia gigantensis]KAG8525811.1 hypothetical protein KY384_000571 [Bacidia gigantensis]
MASAYQGGNLGTAPSLGRPEPPRVSQRHSLDYDSMRPHSGSNAQNFYANQRQHPRANDNEQLMQAKRRMAAQRERELRNYHQEQQYSKGSTVQASSDGATSPSGMNEDDRRELIARQHRALYGNDGPYYEQDNHTPRPANPTSGHPSSAGGRGPSPRTYDPFSLGQGQGQHGQDDAGQLNPSEQAQQGPKGPSPKPQPGSSHENSTASPASNPPSQNFSLFEGTAQQSSRTSTSSPGGSPPRQGKASGPGVAPIGTRPTQASNPALANKRSGTPSQSPLSHGFSATNDNLKPRGGGNERSTSSASNPSGGASKEPTTSAWGSSSGVWGTSGNNNKSVGAVWG